VASKDPADRARGDADPKPVKLALDANTSQRRFSRPSLTMSSTISSRAGDVQDLAGLANVSTCVARTPDAKRKQSLGRDEKATPAPPWKKSGLSTARIARSVVW